MQTMYFMQEIFGVHTGRDFARLCRRFNWNSARKTDFPWRVLGAPNDFRSHQSNLLLYSLHRFPDHRLLAVPYCPD